MKKILFITHEASLTGAPFVVLYIMQWLCQYQEIKMDVLSLKDGALRDEFEKVADNYYTIPKPVTTEKSLLNRGLKKILPRIKKATKPSFFVELASNNYDVVYSNTIVSIAYGAALKKAKPSIKHIAHIHELNTVIQLLLPSLKTYYADIDFFIAASNLVKNNLINRWSLPEEKVKRIYEFSKVKVAKSITNNKKTFVVGGSGTVHWRKGSDLFIQVALYVKKHLPAVSQVKFVWVGSISNIEEIIIKEDLTKAGLSDYVTFVGQQKNPSSYYSDFDVFLMTSREDPFPLVCIEVGMLGKPIVCFKGATGSEEIISKGGGVVVPYLDVEEMGKTVIDYYENQVLVKTHGEINKAQFSNFAPKQIVPEIWDIIKGL